MHTDTAEINIPYPCPFVSVRGYSSVFNRKPTRRHEPRINTKAHEYEAHAMRRRSPTTDPRGQAGKQNTPHPCPFVSIRGYTSVTDHHRRGMLVQTLEYRRPPSSRHWTTVRDAKKGRPPAPPRHALIRTASGAGARRAGRIADDQLALDLLARRGDLLA